MGSIGLSFESLDDGIVDHDAQGDDKGKHRDHVDTDADNRQQQQAADDDGVEHELRVYGPGDHIGELAVLREAPRAATVMAGPTGVRGLMMLTEATADWEQALGRAAEAVPAYRRSLEIDPGAETAAFEPIVSAVEALIPRVEVNEPGLLFAPVSGAVGYYGGEAPLVERVVKEVEDLTGGGFRIGLASGPFAAKQAAARAVGDPPVLVVEDDAAFLSSLDIGAIGTEELVATFRWLGITTLGELARRFGRS